MIIIIKFIVIRVIGWDRHVVNVGELKNAYII